VEDSPPGRVSTVAKRVYVSGARDAPAYLRLWVSNNWHTQHGRYAAAGAPEVPPPPREYYKVDVPLVALLETFDEVGAGKPELRRRLRRAAWLSPTVEPQTNRPCDYLLRLPVPSGCRPTQLRATVGHTGPLGSWGPGLELYGPGGGRVFTPRADLAPGVTEFNLGKEDLNLSEQELHGAFPGVWVLLLRVGEDPPEEPTSPTAIAYAVEVRYSRVTPAWPSRARKWIVRHRRGLSGCAWAGIVLAVGLALVGLARAASLAAVWQTAAAALGAFIGGLVLLLVTGHRGPYASRRRQGGGPWFASSSWRE
jgi:hypothetical protein